MQLVYISMKTSALRIPHMRASFIMQLGHIIEASFSPISTDSLRLQLTQVPRSLDVAIFVSMAVTTTEPIV